MVKALSDAAGVDCCCAPGIPMVCHGFDLVCPANISMSLTGMTVDFGDCQFTFSFSINTMSETGGNTPQWLSKGEQVPGCPNPGNLHGTWALTLTGGPCSSSGGNLCTGGCQGFGGCFGIFLVAEILCLPGPVEDWRAIFQMFNPDVGIEWRKSLGNGSCPNGAGWSVFSASFGGTPATSDGSFTVA